MPGTLALVGQPNVGKSTLFNRLTGTRQKVANYAGATVEKRSGVWHLSTGESIEVMDLPGLYEMSGNGIDEWITASTLINLRPAASRIEGALVVADITTLERSLTLVREIQSLHVPTILILNMSDLADSEGVSVDIDGLSDALGIPVVPISARKGDGFDALEAAVVTHLSRDTPATQPGTDTIDQFIADAATRRPDLVLQTLKSAGCAVDKDLAGKWAELRVQLVEQAHQLTQRHIRHQGTAKHRQFSRRIDDILVHPVWGLAFFLALMLAIFQSVYRWSDPLIGMVEHGIGWAGTLLQGAFGDTMLGNLLVDAGVYGAGNVLVFLPQILILFMWIAILEESGYLARVAFMVDRPMRAAGLSGKSFIPLLSSYACAVPGIMAARTIDHQPTRLVTIFVAPLTTCSARLPVYTLLIGAFVPSRTILGIFNAPGLVLFGLYAAGVLGALLLAKLISIRIDRGIPVPMILELPIYRMPNWRNVLLTLKDRAWIFVRRAGTIIFSISIILWFALSYPQDHQAESRIRANGGSQNDVAAYRIQHSAAGTLGRWIEPAIKPLGYDWKIGVSLIASFAAREVMVATLGTIYNLGETEADSVTLRTALQQDPAWDLATALSVLMFYVFALQCMSTVAIMKRETGGWRWPVTALASTYGIAYITAFITYQLFS